MSAQVSVRLPVADVVALDEAIARGRFSNRSEALRAGLQRLLCEEREQEIDEACARGYGKHPLDVESALLPAGDSSSSFAVARDELVRTARTAG